jgi:hypothetical protein
MRAYTLESVGISRPPAPDSHPELRRGTVESGENSWAGVFTMVLVLLLAFPMQVWAGGTLEVRGGTGAVVYLDGNPVGTAPLKLAQITGGYHQLKIQLPGAGEERVQNLFFPNRSSVDRIVDLPGAQLTTAPAVAPAPPVVTAPGTVPPPAPGIPPQAGVVPEAYGEPPPEEGQPPVVYYVPEEDDSYDYYDYYGPGYYSYYGYYPYYLGGYGYRHRRYRPCPRPRSGSSYHRYSGSTYGSSGHSGKYSHSQVQPYRSSSFASSYRSYGRSHGGYSSGSSRGMSRGGHGRGR